MGRRSVLGEKWLMGCGMALLFPMHHVCGTNVSKRERQGVKCKTNRYVQTPGASRTKEEMRKKHDKLRSNPKGIAV